MTSRTSSCSRWSLSGDRTVANGDAACLLLGQGGGKSGFTFATLTLRLRLLEASSSLWIIQVRRRRHSSRRRLVSPPTESPSFDPDLDAWPDGSPPSSLMKSADRILPDLLPAVSLIARSLDTRRTRSVRRCSAARRSSSWSPGSRAGRRGFRTSDPCPRRRRDDACAPAGRRRKRDDRLVLPLRVLPACNRF